MNNIINSTIIIIQSTLYVSDIPHKMCSNCQYRTAICKTINKINSSLLKYYYIENVTSPLPKSTNFKYEAAPGGIHIRVYYQSYFLYMTSVFIITNYFKIQDTVDILKTTPKGQKWAPENNITCNNLIRQDYP
jgi:hypothetical protein